MNLIAPPRRALCPRCQRPLRTCLCAYITPTDNEVEVLILQHPLETTQAKGSAPLLALSLRRVRIEVGEQFDPEALAQWLKPSPGGHTCLLYPDTPGLPAPPATVPFAPPAVTRLVILDGTWRKSLRMLHANPALQALPRLSLRPETPGRYLIRKAPRAGQLSTLEACCLALGNVEGQQERYRPLLSAFDRFVQAQAELSGLKP